MLAKENTNIINHQYQMKMLLENIVKCMLNLDQAVKTGIDLPVESLGYSGTSKLPGHLLDFSIGQYDTYTPIQLSQYINTIANGGKRLKPYLLKEVYSASSEGDKLGNQIYKAETKELGKLSVEDKYINRVKEGFNAVVLQ